MADVNKQENVLSVVQPTKQIPNRKLSKSCCSNSCCGTCCVVSSDPNKNSLYTDENGYKDVK